MPSSIAIGEQPGFDLKGQLSIRECANDYDYPWSLEGVTKGGHDVAISVSKADAENIYNFVKETYGI